MHSSLLQIGIPYAELIGSFRDNSLLLLNWKFTSRVFLQELLNTDGPVCERGARESYDLTDHCLHAEAVRGLSFINAPVASPGGECLPREVPGVPAVLSLSPSLPRYHDCWHVSSIGTVMEF